MAVTLTGLPPSINIASSNYPTETSAPFILLNAAGGVAPYKFSIVSGSLPNGWSINPFDGSLIGSTIVNIGQFNISIQAQDSTGVLSNVQSTIITISDITPPAFQNIPPVIVPLGVEVDVPILFNNAWNIDGYKNIALITGAIPMGMKIIKRPATNPPQYKGYNLYNFEYALVGAAKAIGGSPTNILKITDAAGNDSFSNPFPITVTSSKGWSGKITQINPTNIKMVVTRIGDGLDMNGNIQIVTES